MLTHRVLPVARKIAAINRGAMSVMSYHPPANWRPISMDDLPQPGGNWQEDYNKNQTKYNIHLAAGISFFVFSVIVAKSSGLFFLNYYPPEKPAE